MPNLRPRDEKKARLIEDEGLCTAILSINHPIGVNVLLFLNKFSFMFSLSPIHSSYMLSGIQDPSAVKKIQQLLEMSTTDILLNARSQATASINPGLPWNSRTLRLYITRSIFDQSSAARFQVDCKHGTFISFPLKAPEISGKLRLISSCFEDHLCSELFSRTT